MNSELLALVTEAERTRVFAYQNMTVDDIPYVMVLTYDYPPMQLIPPNYPAPARREYVGARQ